MRWIDTLVLDRWTLRFPDLPDLGGWDVWSYWERERFDSLQQHLTADDLLVDIGAEFGGLSACIAQFCPRIILVEPEPAMWPTIRAVWEANDLPTPVRTLVALMSDHTAIPDGVDDCEGWPPVSEGVHEDDMEGRRRYRYVHQDAATTPQVALDDWAHLHDVMPTALNIDVEGAELRVLRGAEAFLGESRPKVWVSVHPDLLERDYGETPEQLSTFMDGLGYRETHLATDHEVHMMYLP